jgi:hypothetical protein
VYGCQVIIANVLIGHFGFLLVSMTLKEDGGRRVTKEKLVTHEERVEVRVQRRRRMQEGGISDWKCNVTCLAADA